MPPEFVGTLSLSVETTVVRQAFETARASVSSGGHSSSYWCQQRQLGPRACARISRRRGPIGSSTRLGMRKVVSEDAVRRGLAKIEEAAGLAWLREHLDYCVRPLLSEPWVLA